MRTLDRLHAFSLFVLVVSALSQGALADDAPPLKMHWWWSRASMAEKILPRAREFGLDTIVLENDLRDTGWGDITGNLCDYAFSEPLRPNGAQLELVQQLRNDYRQIIATARPNGVQTFIMCPEVHAPKPFGKLSYDDPKLWALIEDRLRNVFVALPDLAGYVLYLTEGPMVDVENLPGAEPSKAKRAQKLIETCRKACQAEKRKFVVTTFIHSRPMLEAIAEALRNIPPDPNFFVLQYCCPNDWGLYALLNPSIGQVGPHPEILGFDTCAENWGKSAHPFIQSAFMARRLREARQKSSRIVGLAGYAAWTDHTALGTLNEANVYTCQMLIKRPERDGDDILHEWCAKRFGERAGGVAATCLTRTQPAVFKMEHIFGYWVDTTNKSGLPGLDEIDLYMIRDIFGEALAKWDPDPALKATWDGIQHPTEPFLEKVLAEKEEATRMCRQNLQELKQASGAFKGEDSKLLEHAFSFQELWSRLWSDEMHAFFLRQMARTREWPPDMRTRLLAALERYQTDADELEKRFGKDVFPAGPGRAREVIRAMKQEIPGRN